jgi:hypothetical protein
VAGTSVSFPPASLPTDTQITIEEAAAIATATAASQLGIGENIAGSGTAVAIFAEGDTEPIVPYSITLALPPVPDQALLQDESSTLVIFYKVKSVAKNQILLGFIPFANLKVQGESVSFSASHFGAFQATYSKALLPDTKEVAVTSSIQTKREVLDLVPFEMTGRTPFIVSSGDQVTLTGTGFRPSMSIAFGGLKVSSLKVKSETSAIFIPPIKSKFGITDVAANQDGVEQTITVMYRGIKTDLPLITLAEPEVCSEYKYYDITGAEKGGTRGCNASAVSLTDSNYANFIGPWPFPVCSRDGQSGCLTTDRFKSADSDSSIISPWDIRQGKTIAGIRGKLKFCKNSTRLAEHEEANPSAIIGLEDYETIDDDDGGTHGTPEDSGGIGDELCDETGWRAGGIDSGPNFGFCNDREDDCTHDDLMTGLTWSEANPEPVPWFNAIAFCTGTIAGYSDWRLPNLKELNQAAIDGIKWVSSPNFLNTSRTATYWSATTNSSLTAQAWTLNLAVGAAESVVKNSRRYATCVRR